MCESSKIRRAKVTDYQAIAALTRQLGYNEHEEKIKAGLEEILNREEDHVIFVAEEDNIVIGWVHAYLYRLFYANLITEIGGLVVDKDRRRLGTGKELMNSVEKWALEKGCLTVGLRSNVIRKGAHQFYQRIGYGLEKTQYRFKKDLRASFTGNINKKNPRGKENTEVADCLKSGEG